MPVALLTHWRTIAALFAALAMFATGWTVRGWRCDARIAAIEREAQAARDAQARAADRAAQGYEAERAAIVTATDTATTQIRTIYRDRQIPADCEPPADALRVLDNAIAGADDPGQPSPALP